MTETEPWPRRVGNARRLQSMLVTATVLLWLISAMVVASTTFAGGRDGRDAACLRQQPELHFSAIPESVHAVGRWQWLPIGISCEYSSAQTGETTTVAPHPLPTILVAVAAGATVAVVSLAASIRRPRKEENQ